MGTVDFQPFATDPAANVTDQATYLAAVWRQIGFENGIALPEQANKAWRQSTFVAAAIASYVSTQNGGADVLDNGDLAAFVALLTSGLSIGTAVRPARLVPGSGALAVLSSDYALGFNRTAGLAALDATLPAGAQVGQEFYLEDLIGNFQAFPVRVLPPSGTIGNAASFTMNEDKGWAAFRRYAGNLWSVRS